MTPQPKPLRYLSVCSGIEAATVAWHPLGWKPLAFAEIAKFPRKVLAHHYPDVPLHGDFTLLRDMDWIGQADVLIGGTPCQSFSVAGLRGGLSDARGNLTLEFVRLANAVDDLRPPDDPATIVWENVPGVLSSRDNAFGALLAGLGGCDAPIVNAGPWPGAGVVAGPRRVVAWRILDAQFFGVAQRRRRVFVVAVGRSAYCNGWSAADALLPIGESVPWDSEPSREAWEAAAGGAAGGSGGVRQVVGALCSDAHPGSYSGQDAYTGRLIPVVFQWNAGSHGMAIGNGMSITLDKSNIPAVSHAPASAVRRLTPTECERLQGFPDHYTAIPGAADGPRYAALGNSMAVPVIAWIGRRIELCRA
jgi:DNA (cytosine-5)-methyltransferase 1